MKNVSGYLIVRFNARELKANEGTGLGEFGVMDPELYTGCLDVDRGAMEYDDAGTLEEAVSLAAGLGADTGDIPEPEENPLHVQAVTALAEQEALARSFRHPDNVQEVLHEVHGLTGWLSAAHIITKEECGQWDDRIGNVYMALRKPSQKRFTAVQGGRTNEAVFALGLALEADCPDNDCAVYRNFFCMARSADEQTDKVTGWAREALTREARRLYGDLERMYHLNHAVVLHRRKLEAQAVLDGAEFAPELMEFGLTAAAIRICERFPYLAREVHDTEQFVRSVSGMTAALALLTDEERRRLGQLLPRRAAG